MASPRKVRFAEKQDNYFEDDNNVIFSNYKDSDCNNSKQDIFEGLDNGITYKKRAVQYNTRRQSLTCIVDHSKYNENQSSKSNSQSKRSESGIQRLEYELSNLKSRLFDNLQEFEDLKDSFPDKKFPATWEPRYVKNLRSKITRLTERIEREKNKIQQKENEKDVKKMMEILLQKCEEENFDSIATVDELDMSTTSERTTDINAALQEALNKSTKQEEFQKKKNNFNDVAVYFKDPKEVKSRQEWLFKTRNAPPRNTREREANKAAFHCALTKLPPLSKRYKPKQIAKISPGKEHVILIPNKRRVTYGRAFIHERQKEFTNYHKKILNEMDVTFTSTAFESLLKH